MLLIAYLFRYKMKYIAQICILFINKLYNNIKNTRKKSGKCIVQNVVFNFLFF